MKISGYSEISKEQFMANIADQGAKITEPTYKTDQHGYTEAVWECMDYFLIRHTQDGLVVRCYIQD